MIIIFVSASISPGIGDDLSTADFPLIYGFKLAYDIPHRFGVLLGFIPIFSSCLGFMYGCKQQMHSMALSGILPRFFKPVHSLEDIRTSTMKMFSVHSNNSVSAIPANSLRQLPVMNIGESQSHPTENHSDASNQQPIRCLLTNSLIQFLLILLLTYAYDGHPYQICCIGANSVYFGLFLAYIIFKTRFSGLHREFEAPGGIIIGVVGAVLALAMWAAMIFLQEDPVEVTIYLVYMVLAIIYYFAYAQKHQFFSKEEQEKFMKAYILNGKRR